MYKIRTGVKYDVVKLVVALVVALISISSLCKRRPNSYIEPTNVSNNSGRSENPSIAVDSRNTVHLVWNDDTPGNEEIFYATKSVNGTWSTPVQVTNNIGASRNPYIVIDRTDKIHLVWQQVVERGSSTDWEIFYSWRFSGDTWATPETISAHGASLCPIIAVDNDIGLHLFWFEGFASDQCLYYYGYKPNGGQWQVQYLFTTSIALHCEMKVDNRKGVHIVLDPYFETYYIEKRPDGTWSDTMRISHSPVNDWETSNSPSIAISDDGTIHVVWTEGDTALYGIAYTEKTPQGTWGQIEAPYKGKVGVSRAKIRIGSSGKIHLVWMLFNIGYGVRDQGAWKEPKILIEKSYNTNNEKTMVIDHEEKIYYAWTYETPNTYPRNNEIYYFEYKE